MIVEEYLPFLHEIGTYLHYYIFYLNYEQFIVKNHFHLQHANLFFWGIEKSLGLTFEINYLHYVQCCVLNWGASTAKCANYLQYAAISKRKVHDFDDGEKVFVFWP